MVAEKQADAVSQNEQVAYELEKIEGIENFDDETIKALSVILRTNLLKNETLPDLNTTTSNQRLVELASQTDGEILVEENSNSFEPFKITAEEVVWKKEIKKADILKYLKENNISLSNLSNIETEKQSDGRTKTLKVGGKGFDIKELINRFDIPSNNIYNIENKLSSIIIEGKEYGMTKNFVISEAQKEAKEGQNYKKILKNRYNNFNIITNK